MNPNYRLTALLMGTTVLVAQPFFPATSIAAVQVGKLAEDVTVFIQGVNNPDNFGSGVIIGRSGKTYTVLTAAHVVVDSDQYTIKTVDGLGYSLKNVKRLSGVDLAVVQFESGTSYTVASLGDSDQVAQTDAVYVAGFPKPGQNITVPIFTITTGTISSIIRRQNQTRDGYALAYSNETRAGMSGGPVFNSAGQVIGIHGRKEGELGGGATNGAWLNLGVPINFYKSGGGGTQVASISDSTAQSALEAQRRAQQQAALEAQQRAQQQAALEAQKRAQQQAALEAQQRAQQQAELEAQQRAQQQAQQPSKIATSNILTAIRPINLIVPQSVESSGSSTRQVCEDLRINMIVTKRCRTETVATGRTGNESASSNSPEAYVNNGNQFASSGSYKNAIDSYTTAIQRNSGLAAAFFNRGLAYGMLNQKENAITDFSKALDLFKAQGESQKYQQTQDILQRLTQAAS